MMGWRTHRVNRDDGKGRQTVTQGMLAQARDLGADAVTNVRFMTASVLGSAAELLTYGTPVKLKQSAWRFTRSTLARDHLNCRLIPR